MNTKYYDLMEKRRSVYALTNKSTISQEKIKEVVEHSLNHTPSAFNSQSGRVVILYAEDHKQFWDMILSALKANQAEDRHKETEERIQGFKNAYGTALFFEDYEVIENLQEQFESMQENFPIWSYQASGMLQYNVWTSLAAEGLGASLQHYNGLIDNDINKKWDLPLKWKMMAQMPFGKPASAAGEKEIIDSEKKLRIFGSK